MVYAAMAIASLVVSLRIFSIGVSVQGTTADNAYAEELAAVINSNVGYSSSEFSAYVPKSICNATFANGTMTIGGYSIALASELTIASGAICGQSGGPERLLMYRASNGSYALTVDT